MLKFKLGCYTDDLRIKKSLNLCLDCGDLVVGHFAKLMLFGLCLWVSVESVLNYVSTDSAKVTGGPCEYISILAKEFQQLFFFFWVEGCTDGDYFV